MSAPQPIPGDKTIEFHDSGPDHLGRRFFTIEWYNRGGDFQPEPSKRFPGPVGFQRGQCFFCDPARFLAGS